MLTEYQLKKKLEKKPNLKAFMESEDNDKACRLISMAYLLHSIANSFTDEANDLMRKYGVWHHDIKYHGNNLVKAFDCYNRTITKLIIGERGREAFVADFEAFEPVCRKYMDLDIVKEE